MSSEEPTRWDYVLMDRVLEEARNDLAQGGGGVAALLAAPDNILAVARNMIQATDDMTDHAEMVLLRRMGKQLRAMKAEDRRALSIYVTLEPCLMCGAALSFVGIKRIVYAAIAEDANPEELIVRDLTLPTINDRLVRGPFILVPGLRRSEGQALLRQMGKAAGSAPDLET